MHPRYLKRQLLGSVSMRALLVVVANPLKRINRYFEAKELLNKRVQGTLSSRDLVAIKRGTTMSASAAMSGGFTT